MTGGWLVGVMVKAADQPTFLRHYYAIGCEEQARAEWMAVDLALKVGHVSPGPIGGAEPVETIREIPPQRMRRLGLAPGEVRALGWKHPRQWLS